MSTLLEKRNFYFRGFPTVEYAFYNGNAEILDFFHRWKVRDAVKNNIAAYSEWTIRDSDSLLMMSKRLYGSEHFYWIIMMMNDMTDPIYCWPLNETNLFKFALDKYGAGSLYTLHHWESEYDANVYALPADIIVSESYQYNKISISNFEYESRLNEGKRSIKLLDPEYLSQIKEEKDKIIATNYITG